MLIDDIIRRNREAGYHFFDAESMRFFKSRVSRVTFGRYFVTSERFENSAAYPRRYTVRAIRENGSIDDVYGFQAFATKRAAESAALHAAMLEQEKAADMEIAGPVCAWLESMFASREESIRDVKPVSIKVGKTKLIGARYVQTETAGSVRESERFYLLGKLPASHGRAYYRIDDDPRDWYIGAYYQGEAAEFQPFGPNVMIFAWPEKHDDGRPFGPIDPDPFTTKRRMSIDVIDLAGESK